MLINLSNIGKSFGSKKVLQGVSFQVNAGEKLGLVGRNGSGKTTLFRVIQGSLEADEGQITRLPQLRVGLMQQIAEIDSDQTVFESALSVFSELEELANTIAWLESEIESKAQESDLNSLLDRYGQLQTQWELAGGYSYEAKTKSVLSGLGFNEHALGRKTNQLSGGERNRLNLAKLLLSEPNLLLLDEPTNHLDIDAVCWLETFLKDYSNAFIVVSHDRYFLDGTAHKILEISEGKIEEYVGNYSRYITERENRRAQRQKAYEEQQAFVSKTEEFIRRNIAGQKTKQAKSRRKMLGKLERLENSLDHRPAIQFHIGIENQSGELVFRLSGATVGYGQKAIVQEIDLSLYRGQALGIVGPNGSGKTTFLKTITGDLPLLKGKIQMGREVELAYYEQQLSTLDPQLTVLEQMRCAASFATDETLRNFLAQFLFRGEEVFHFTKSLSGGEKSRLALAKLIYSKANTLVLDEPTNHLDIPACEALEEALQGYPGTLIIVSHDRYLINKLADQILYFDGLGNCIHFDGGYEDFERYRAGLESADEQHHRVDEAKSARVEKQQMSAQSGLSKNEISKIRDRCAYLEKEVERVEALIMTTTNDLNNPELARDYKQFKLLSDLHEELTSSLDHLYIEWEKYLELLEQRTNVL